MGNARQVVAGIELFLLHKPNLWVCAEHDEIFGPGVGEIELSQAERQHLEELGWFIDSDVDVWATFV